MEGQSRPPTLQFEGAGYEFLILALDPDKPVPDPDAWPERVHWLMPPDLVEQVTSSMTDAQIVKLLEGMADAIIAGRSSPDSDFRSWWKAFLRNSVEHELLGGHPKERS